MSAVLCVHPGQSVFTVYLIESTDTARLPITYSFMSFHFCIRLNLGAGFSTGFNTSLNTGLGNSLITGLGIQGLARPGFKF